MLEAKQLVKAYDGRTVLNGVSFKLGRGEAAVLTGINGSGKSTLLKIIAGVLSPDKGSVSLIRNKEGSECSPFEIGYVPERFPKLPFTPMEYFVHMARVRGLRRQEILPDLFAMVELCRLEQALHTPIRHFSKGMLQKPGLIQALLMKPRLLVLDEPFSGLDAASQQDILKVLAGKRADGAALLFSCHEAGLAEGLASRKLVLSGGSIAVDESWPDLQLEQPPMRITACGIGSEAAGRLASEMSGLFEADGDLCRFTVPRRSSDAMLLKLLGEGASILSVVETAGQTFKGGQT